MNRALALAFIGALVVHGLAMVWIPRDLIPAENPRIFSAHSVHINMQDQKKEPLSNSQDSSQTTSIANHRLQKTVSERMKSSHDIKPVHPVAKAQKIVSPKPVISVVPSSKPTETLKEVRHAAQVQKKPPLTAVNTDPVVSQKAVKKESSGIKSASIQSENPENNPGDKQDVSTPPDALLRLIHAAVAQQKQYPSRARRRGWQGRPVVRFTLHPSGLIDRISLVSGSPYTVLDKAALRAVNTASPIAGVRKYMHKPMTMKLGLRFQLE